MTNPIVGWPTYVLDCPDARALADFYAALTGLPAAYDPEDGWAEVNNGERSTLAFQEVTDYNPPEWPGQDVPQQAHLDFYVTDLDAGEAAVLELGARKHDVQPGTSFRVFLDPAGHPFCLCQE
jgi:hypothetical protein